MRKKNKNSSDLKMCPFFDEMCKGSDCMLYHEQFERCELALMNYNIFKLAEALNNFETETKK